MARRGLDLSRVSRRKGHDKQDVGKKDHPIPLFTFLQLLLLLAPMSEGNPILNNPYEEPRLHYATNVEGELDYE